MGPIVDKPQPGSGTSNDGNTARRFFRNSKQSSDITGINEELIRRFCVILETIASGYDINLEAFRLYTAETKTLYMELYPWYFMPVTVHKILVHSTEIIKSCILPIGQLSEEAQEARNKDLRKFREGHTRKKSRISTNQDLLSMLLVSSDPLISSLRKLPVKKSGSLSPQVINLLLPSPPVSSSATSEASGDISSETDSE